MTNEREPAWPIWIDETKRVIAVKKLPGGQEIFFENREIGMKKICELLSRGYKIG